jgi:hypothetical protein
MYVYVYISGQVHIVFIYTHLVYVLPAHKSHHTTSILYTVYRSALARSMLVTLLLILEIIYIGQSNTYTQWNDSNPLQAMVSQYIYYLVLTHPLGAG